jgi:hypothetical protein
METVSIDVTEDWCNYCAKSGLYTRVDEAAEASKPAYQQDAPNAM